MKLIKRSIPAILFLLLPTAAAASSWEFSLGGSFCLPFQNSTWQTRYTPDMRYETPLPGSLANQNLHVEGQSGAGLFLAINHLFSPHWGVQALVDWHRTNLEGTHNTYDVHLVYSTLMPPDYIPTQATRNDSHALPDTDGHLNHLTTSLNLVTRMTLGSHLSADLSGGLSLFRLQGEASALGHAWYWLGGHGVLFSEFAHLGFKIDPTTTLGGNVGGTLNVHISRTMVLFLTCRWYLCPKVSAKAALSEILNSEEIIMSMELDDMATAMSLPKIRLNPSFLNLGAGFGFSF